MSHHHSHKRHHHKHRPANILSHHKYKGLRNVLSVAYDRNVATNTVNAPGFYFR